MISSDVSEGNFLYKMLAGDWLDWHADLLFHILQRTKNFKEMHPVDCLQSQYSSNSLIKIGQSQKLQASGRRQTFLPE